MKPPVALLAAFALATSLAACSGDPTSAASAPAEGEAGTPAEAPEAGVPVLDAAAAFYPLEFALQRIGGDRVSVTSLTQPGADPHDAELTPREVGQLSAVDLVVYLAEFQPAVDDAVGSVAGERALEVSGYADLTLTAVDDGHGHDDDDHDDGEEALDPHFWLDPTRYASVAEAITDRLIELDPEGAQEYEARSAEFTAELTTLDEEFSTALAACTHRDLVTGHAAFGYLADRYDLHQEGISGLSTESEPSAAAMRDLVEHVRESGVTTIYAETLASPALTETIARESGAQVAVLDPIEGITDTSAGSDYFEIMRANLQTLRQGQDCS